MTTEDKQVLHDAALILRKLADEGKVLAFGPARGVAGILAQRLEDMRLRDLPRQSPRAEIGAGNP